MLIAPGVRCIQHGSRTAARESNDGIQRVMRIRVEDARGLPEGVLETRHSVFCVIISPAPPLPSHNPGGVLRRRKGRL